MNFRKETVRQIVFDIGIKAFSRNHYNVGDTNTDPAPEAAQDVDGAASSQHFEKANPIRYYRTEQYHKDPFNFYMMFILITTTNAYDIFLLYDLLGDPLQNKNAFGEGKIQKLVDPNASNIALVQEDLYFMCISWQRGGHSRRPWCVLVALGASFSCQKLKRNARGSAFRMTSVTARR